MQRLRNHQGEERDGDGTEQRGGEVDSLGNVAEGQPGRYVRQQNIERKAWRMRHAEMPRGNDQLTAID